MLIIIIVTITSERRRIIGMKLTNLFRSLRAKLVTLFVLALAVLFPAVMVAADAVHLEGAIGVANVTTGETVYTGNTNASFDQVVKYQVYYHNTELPDSGKIAQNLRVKIALPNAPGQTQTTTATISADNTNTVTDSATVNLNRADAYLQYVPGSAVWRHNTGTNDAPVWTEAKVSDDVVNSGAGLVLENEKPCYNFAATVTVLARVIVPSVEITKQVRIKGSTQWEKSITANAGQSVEYLIGYKNAGNVQQNKVVIADKLPTNVTYVGGTTQVKNAYWNGVYTTVPDGVTSGGINIGNYTPGSNAYVKFEATLPASDKLTCGVNLLTNKATAQPEGMNYYYSTADVTVTKDCTTPTPVYSCDDLVLTPNYDNRTVSALVKYTAKDGATYKNSTLVWGDSKQDVITGTTASHQYVADGTYTVKANVLFTVNGVDKTPAVNPACSKTVTFSTTTKTPSVNIVKTVEKPEVEVGQNYNYTLKVTNDGQVDLTNVKVYDTPATGSNIQLVSANGVGTITGNTWNYTIPSLKVGESKTFTLTAKVTAYMAGNLVNNACVNAPEVNPSEPNKDDDCSDVPVTVKKPVVSVPVYSCDAVTLTSGANRTVTAKVEYTAKDGARLKVVTYNWGDNATFASDKTSADHTYASDGTYSVNVRLLFDVNGTDKYAADNTNCVKSVTFTTPTTPPTTPETPQVLPDTGAGSVVGLFGLVSVLSAIGYRLFMSRKLARES